MDYFIVARSKSGWGVALGCDVLAEFDAVDQARAHATELIEVVRALGGAADLVDLSDGPGPTLLSRN